MTDIVDKKTRSRIMSAIGGKNTTPELALRRFLHRQGFRFRLHKKNLPGRPDLVLAKHRVAVFVHGCFWHRHLNCSNSVLPATNSKFWLTKLTQNQIRDSAQIAALRAEGWRVGIFWECAARKGRADERALKGIARWIKQKSGYKEFPEKRNPDSTSSRSD